MSATNMHWTLYRAPNQTAFDAVKKEGLKHPLLGFLGAPWAKAGKILPPLDKEQQKRYDEVWKRLAKYREE